jgi:hypothetical protein
MSRVLGRENASGFLRGEGLHTTSVPATITKEKSAGSLTCFWYSGANVKEQPLQYDLKMLIYISIIYSKIN